MHLNDRILAVDDSEDNLFVLNELLAGAYTVQCASSGEEALAVAPVFRPDLVLLDVMMPGLNGIQTCRRLRELPELTDTKIVMLSARSELDPRLKAYALGAVDYITKPFDHQEILAKVRAWMQMVYKERINEVLSDTEKTREVIGFALVTLAGLRDLETGDHLFRIRWYSQALAEQLAVTGPYSSLIDETFLQHLYRASPLHDIGKVAVDDAILRKPGPLTASEFTAMKQHTVAGSDILVRAAERLSSADYMQMAAEIARHHHEKFDGSGYPDGLEGIRIPLAARIVSVADVFDALTARRVYKPAMSVFDAAGIIAEGAGTQFDPVIVEAFRARLDDFHLAHARFADQNATSPDADLIGSRDADTCIDGGPDHVEFFAQLDAVTSPS